MTRLLKNCGFDYLESYEYSLSAQYWFEKVKRLLPKKNGKGAPGKQEETKPARNSALKSLLVKTYLRILHGMRYQLGAILPKAGRPQTVFIVARKPSTK
jgi:hypothetical protein